MEDNTKPSIIEIIDKKLKMLELTDDEINKLNDYERLQSSYNTLDNKMIFTSSKSWVKDKLNTKADITKVQNDINALKKDLDDKINIKLSISALSNNLKNNIIITKLTGDLKTANDKIAILLTRISALEGVINDKLSISDLNSKILSDSTIAELSNRINTLESRINNMHL